MKNMNEVELRFTHAGNCTKKLEDCHICQSNMEFFNSMSPDKLAACLEDRRPTKGQGGFHPNIGVICVENFISRTKDNVRKVNGKEHQTPRAENDVAVGFAVFSKLQNMGVEIR